MRVKTEIIVNDFNAILKSLKGVIQMIFGIYMLIAFLFSIFTWAFILHSVYAGLFIAVAPFFISILLLRYTTVFGEDETLTDNQLRILCAVLFVYWTLLSVLYINHVGLDCYIYCDPNSDVRELPENVKNFL